MPTLSQTPATGQSASAIPTVAPASREQRQHPTTVITPVEIELVKALVVWWVDRCFRAEIELDAARRRIRDVEAELHKRPRPVRRVG